MGNSKDRNVDCGRGIDRALQAGSCSLRVVSGYAFGCAKSKNSIWPIEATMGPLIRKRKFQDAEQPAVRQTPYHGHVGEIRCAP